MKHKTIFLILALMLVSMMGLVHATEVDIDMDVDSGNIELISSDDVGSDTESKIQFRAIGGFTGTLNANDDNTDSIMNTLLDMQSKSTTIRSRFDFESSHNLGTANSNDNKMTFTSWVEGSDITMDLYTHNLLYQSQIERVGNNAMLTAADTTNYWMGYEMINGKRDDSNVNAMISATLEGDGTGWLGKEQYGSNHLARGIGYNQDKLDVREGYVSATGNGQFIETAYGENSLTMNGFEFGSGWGQFVGQYSGSFSGKYSAYAK